jgi:hypothetical protein
MSHELRIGVWVGEEDAVSDVDRVGIPLTEERLYLLPAERGAVQAARKILLRSSVALPRARSGCDARQGDLT